jgi:hypothetical protein
MAWPLLSIQHLARVGWTLGDIKLLILLLLSVMLQQSLSGFDS